MSGCYYEEGMKYVKIQARIFAYQERIDRQETEEAGMDGLMFAVNHYQPGKGEFKTFVVGCIRKHIIRRINKIQKSKKNLVSLSCLPERLQPATKRLYHNPRIANILKRANRKERVVLQGIMDGYTQEEIGEQLGVTDRTIRNIINKVKKKHQP